MATYVYLRTYAFQLESDYVENSESKVVTLFQVTIRVKTTSLVATYLYAAIFQAFRSFKLKLK